MTWYSSSSRRPTIIFWISAVPSPLKAQLSSYDEQLAVLEQILGPLAEWSRTWADLEQRLLNMDPRPEAGT